MILKSEFYQRDVLEVAPDLLGKVLVRRIDGNLEIRGLITEVEAYRGEEDLACHARVGKTNRTKVMYMSGGAVYMYLIYGMYWMLNIVTGVKDEPQAVLVRGVWVPREQVVLTNQAKNIVFGLGESLNGPGKLTKYLGLDKKQNGIFLSKDNDLWVEDVGLGSMDCEVGKRIGVNYAGEWADKEWRWKIVSK